MLLKSILLFAAAIVVLFVITVLGFGAKVSAFVEWCQARKWWFIVGAVLLSALAITLIFLIK